MDISEILSQLSRYTGNFPRAAVEAAIAQKEEIAPELLRILEEAINRGAELEPDQGRMDHIYALFLLAQVRDVRAFPLLIRLSSLPGDHLYSLFGDIITEHFGRILASVSGGKTDGIRHIIENEDVDEWVRGAGLIALLTLVAEGQLARSEVVEYFAQLFRGRLKRQPGEVWNSLVACASDLHPAELMKDIQHAYRDGLVDPRNISIHDVERDLAISLERALARLASNHHHRMVMDTVKEMGRWACFQPKESREIAPNPSSIAVSSTPVRDSRTNRKIGRNEPCPCGSGKKFKKCCGA